MVKLIFDKETIYRIIFLGLLFLISVILGLYFGKYIFNEVPLTHNFKVQVDEKSFQKLLRYIFFRNYLVALLLVFIGYFTGGIVTVLMFAMNGLTFGFQLNFLQIEKLNGIDGFVYRLIFHAPIEIFSFCLMGSLGLRGFDLVVHFIKTKEYPLVQKIITKQMILQYFIGTFFLFIAALIESFVPKILQYVEIFHNF